MRIDRTTLGVEARVNTKARRAGQTKRVGSASAGDIASFSSDQTRLQSLGAQVLAQPEVRDNKVHALQEAIGKGDYSVAPNQVADALVNDLAS
jgi:flagellar biosynthesis anti-sigma factor FlgM